MITELGKIYLVHRHSPFVWHKLIRYVSWAIRIFTKSYYSHTTLCFEWYSEKYIFESDGGIVRCMRYDSWCKDAIVCIENIDLLESNKKHLFLVALNQLGKGYDNKGTLIDQLIFQVSGRWTGHTGSYAKDKFYCSEYVAYCLNEVLGTHPNWYKTSPADLYNEKRFKTVFTGKAIDFK